jgi:hypothetical protein
MTLHLTRLSRLWTFQVLGFEAFQVWLHKKATSTISIDTQRRDFRPLVDKTI